MNDDVETIHGPPKPLSALIKALENLRYLEDAHARVLLKDQPAGVPVPDEETVFMQAGIALLCAAWEAYVEDLALLGFEYMLGRTSDPIMLPLTLRKAVALSIQESKHELSPWILAGDGWKDVVRKQIIERVESLHTPKPDKIDALFEDVLGIKKIFNCCEWEHFSNAFVRQTMLRMVEQRGAIAHGRSPNVAMGYNLLSYWKHHVVECAFLLNNHLVDTFTPDPAPPCWAIGRTNADWATWAKISHTIRKIIENKELTAEQTGS